jgi:hypothetical protein
MKIIKTIIILAVLTSQLLCVDFNSIETGMSKRELLHRLGNPQTTASTSEDEYLFYVDRWIWLLDGMVKGYILHDDWDGAYGSYGYKYKRFNSRSASEVSFSRLQSAMSRQEIVAILGNPQTTASTSEDEYLFYVDRWIWLLDGMVKGYILHDDWDGAYGSYGYKYKRFND